MRAGSSGFESPSSAFIFERNVSNSSRDALPGGAMFKLFPLCNSILGVTR